MRKPFISFLFFEFTGAGLGDDELYRELVDVVVLVEVVIPPMLLLVLLEDLVVSLLTNDETREIKISG
jgi:hypothetical protein